ncbi:MAG: EamA family transporter, partial [bacterium]|nr:EamA family transporter [bacterium]
MGALHLAILLFGAAGLLGRELGLDPLAITAGRSLVAGLALGLVLLVRKEREGRVWPGWRWMLGAGALLAFHWSCFFDAVQQGGVPLALLSYALFPVFSLFLERLAPPTGRSPAAAPGLSRQVALLALLGAGLVLLAGPDLFAAAGRLRGLAGGLAAGASFALLARGNAARVRREGALALAAA